MNTVAAGGWVEVWLSPVALFLFDVAFAAVFLYALGVVFRIVRRRRKPKTPSQA